MPILKLKHGDCLEVLKKAPDNYADSLVTDPPAGIAFMGKDWDKDKGGRDGWVAWMTEVMKECHRVLKPGAHGLVWAIPRTAHWTATALEDAGFEIRDCITHLFGSGFPKSLNVAKAGADSDWQGWGTALKPAVEFWWLVRKPLGEKTVAANVLKHGTGGLNIDGCRIASADVDPSANQKSSKPRAMAPGGAARSVIQAEQPTYNPQGRFPANLVLSHSEGCSEVCEPDCAVRMLDEQSGYSASDRPNRDLEKSVKAGQITRSGQKRLAPTYQDAGGASRFFYCAKASRSDRGAGNTHPTVKASKLMGYLIRLITPPGGTVLDPFMGSGSTGVAAVSEGFGFVGIEKEDEYFDIASTRLGGAA